MTGDQVAPSQPASKPLPISADGDVAAALQQAIATSKPIEVPSLSTETSVTVVNPDGSQTKRLSAGPLRVQRNGAWVPVDPSLVNVNGQVRTKATPGDPVFSGGSPAGGVLASLTTNGKTVSYRWPGALPAPTLSGNVATYPNVVANGDLVLTATTRGFEVSLLLRKAPAKALVIDLPMSADGVQLTQEPNGDLTWRDPAGQIVAHAPSPRMYTTARDPISGRPARVAPIPNSVVQTPSGPGLQMRPDQAWLTNPATTYPVVVDPSTNLSVTLDDSVDSAWPNENYDGAAELDVGTYNGGGSKNWESQSTLACAVRADRRAIDEEVDMQVNSASWSAATWGAFSDRPVRRQASAGPGGISSTVSPQDLTDTGRSLGISDSQLTSLLAGGRMAFTASAAGVSPDDGSSHAGIPFGPDGGPDLDKIAALGGTVKGAIPPGGYPKMTLVSDHQVTYYAAEITMPGAQPVYLKGMDLRTDPNSSAKTNLGYVQNALHYLLKLPNSYEEGQRRLGENFFDGAGSGSLIDVQL